VLLRRPRDGTAVLVVVPTTSRPTWQAASTRPRPGGAVLLPPLAEDERPRRASSAPLLWTVPVGVVLALPAYGFAAFTWCGLGTCGDDPASIPWVTAFLAAAGVPPALAVGLVRWSLSARLRTVVAAAAWAATILVGWLALAG
jgi:hypothetical protein